MRLKRNRYFPMLVKQDIPAIKSRFIADSFIVGGKPHGLYAPEEGFAPSRVLQR